MSKCIRTLSSALQRSSEVVCQSSLFWRESSSLKVGRNLDALQQVPLMKPPPRMDAILGQFFPLYPGRIVLPHRRLGADEQPEQKSRASHCAPRLKLIEKYLRRIQSRHLPQSLMVKAITYALNQWSGLEAYLKDGRVELDNNFCENTIRPLKIGAKNYLFFGSRRGGELACVDYTLIETCKRHGLDARCWIFREISGRFFEATGFGDACRGQLGSVCRSLLNERFHGAGEVMAPSQTTGVVAYPSLILRSPGDGVDHMLLLG